MLPSSQRAMSGPGAPHHAHRKLESRLRFGLVQKSIRPHPTTKLPATETGRMSHDGSYESLSITGIMRRPQL